MIAYDCCGYTTDLRYRDYCLTKHQGKLLALELLVIAVAVILLLAGGINQVQTASSKLFSEALNVPLMMAGGITLAVVLILEASVTGYHYHRLIKIGQKTEADSYILNTRRS